MISSATHPSIFSQKNYPKNMACNREIILTWICLQYEIRKIGCREIFLFYSNIIFPCYFLRQKARVLPSSDGRTDSEYYTTTVEQSNIFIKPQVGMCIFQCKVSKCVVVGDVEKSCIVLPPVTNGYNLGGSLPMTCVEHLVQVVPVIYHTM
jgi:hypothetical protein